MCVKGSLVMSRLQLLICISALCLQVASSQEDCEFAVDPEDTTVEVNDTDVLLTCMPRLDNQFITWQLFLRNGTFWTIDGSDVDTHRSRGLEFIPATGSLKILRVQPFHAGLYRCEGLSLSVDDQCRYFSDNATVTVRGRAEVEITDGPSFSVNTTERLQINGIISGQPDPNITLYKVENGREVVISNDHPRITVDSVATRLTIAIEDVRVNDKGIYQVKAANEVGNSSTDFTVMTQGPDRPYVNVPEIIVAELHQVVQVPCSVQMTAYVDNSSRLELNWKVNGSVVTSSPSSIYVRRESDINLMLIIRNITHSGDRFTCEAHNIRNSSQGNTVIYVPPTPPKPDIEGDTISWEHISTDVPIVMYMVEIFEADTDNVMRSYEVAAPLASRTLTITVGNLPAGEYEVRVVAVASNGSSMALSTPSPSARFRVRASDANSIAIIAPVAGSVGGVLILIVVGVLVGAFFLCFYSHRRQMNSQQQRWGSEDKVDAAAIPNTYTTLALGNSELPPSPNTPLISSFFSTEVDPKWEFPRENIQLKDVLHEGQFTILCKGTVKGIRERMIDVAIKSVRDVANEDDVKALVSEMETLAGLGPHPNIVSLLRVCTVGSPMYIVMEYMCHGDLLGFLRASRGHHGLYHISPGTRNQPPTLNLCSRDLLNVATKIANGMRYLSDRKVVHRTLCAKNVLVGPGMDIKIYNVGSFDASFENREYYMKWMAPETLFDHTTTTYSDVWSYGITLWELVTVGGAPYAEILPEDLYSQLHNGMRMPKPQHCAQEVYDIMWQCWQRNPTDRPHFAVIHESLEELLESKISYLDLRQYDGYAYSQFDDAPPQFSTAL